MNLLGSCKSLLCTSQDKYPPTITLCQLGAPQKCRILYGRISRIFLLFCLPVTLSKLELPQDVHDLLYLKT